MKYHTTASVSFPSQMKRQCKKIGNAPCSGGRGGEAKSPCFAAKTRETHFCRIEIAKNHFLMQCDFQQTDN